MKVSKRVYEYALENFDAVAHTTLNPERPGVVRIHMIPPKIDGRDIQHSVVIINGQDIIPVSVSWAVLLFEFIKRVNKYEGKPLTADDMDDIANRTVKGVKKVFPFVSSKRILNDIWRIMDTFEKIAYGEEPMENIGYMTMGDYAPFMEAPHRMDLMVSAMERDGKWNCNQQCVHCYAAGQEHSNEKELSTKEWKRIIDILRRSKTPQITFTGGEPTMRDDLIELIDYSKWFVTRLNTNGIRLSKEYCEKLYDASLDSLQITFYSENSEIHNKLVGAAHYDDTVNGIKNALEKGLSVSINTPLCTLNKDYVKTLEFLHELGVCYVTCSGLITTGNALKDESVNLQLSKDELKEILRKATEYCFSNGMEISFTSPGWIENEYFDELLLTTPTCGACLSNMAISPSGNVVPCQSWLNGETLGNILESTFEEIWNNEECKKRRDYSAKMTGLCPLRVLDNSEGRGKA